MATPTDWHEFWVTIQGDTSGGGTHRVDVYMDGSTTPTTFHVTSGTGEDEGRDYLVMEQGATPQSGALDIDFVASRVKAAPRATRRTSGTTNIMKTANGAIAAIGM